RLAGGRHMDDYRAPAAAEQLSRGLRRSVYERRGGYEDSQPDPVRPDDPRLYLQMAGQMAPARRGGPERPRLARLRRQPLVAEEPLRAEARAASADRRQRLRHLVGVRA